MDKEEKRGDDEEDEDSIDVEEGEEEEEEEDEECQLSIDPSLVRSDLWAALFWSIGVSDAEGNEATSR